MKEKSTDWLKRVKATRNYREYIGPLYDDIGTHQFIKLVEMGLHPEYKLLDIGCGSLSGGRYFMSFLDVGNYYGIEPNAWLIDEVIRNELGQAFIDKRQAHFSYDDDFDFAAFGTEFDVLLAHSIFTHAPKHVVRRCVSEAANVMHDQSRFYGTFFRGYGKAEYKGKDWQYPKGIFYKYETLFTLFQDHGLKFNMIPCFHPYLQTWFVATK